MNKGDFFDIMLDDSIEGYKKLSDTQKQELDKQAREFIMKQFARYLFKNAETRKD